MNSPFKPTIHFNVSTNGNSNKMEENVTLILNDTEIHSLKELREHFNTEEILKAFFDNSLMHWLEQHFYDREAAKVSELSIEDSSCLQKLCTILSVNYTAHKPMTEQERQEFDARRTLISTYTSDATVLANPWNVAINQTELVTLINKGTKDIFLCNECFSIPIRIPGISYTLIGNATLENPYTLEQYARAGISIKGIELPATTSETHAQIAREAAIANGYDDFADNHCPLTVAIHNMLKSCPIYDTFCLTYDSSVSSKFYKSKAECKSAREKCIRKAYDECERRICAEDSKSISKQAVDFYGETIERTFASFMDDLKHLCTITDTTNAFQNLEALVVKCRNNLRSAFNAELHDNIDYYKMYDFNYFLEEAEIEEHDFRVSEGGIGKLLETVFMDNVQYTIPDIYSSISEMERDMHDRASTFFKSAYREYQSYISQLETQIEIIGKGLPAFSDNETVSDYIARMCVHKIA